MAFHESLTKEKVARRIKLGDFNQRRDFFAHILRDGGFNRDHLAEQAKILLLDGSETTATFLAGVTYLLLKSPTALSKLQCEVRSSFASLDEIRGDSLNQLPYLRAAIEEGLRLFPPVPLGLPRTCPGAMIDGCLSQSLMSSVLNAGLKVRQEITRRPAVHFLLALVPV
uniref:Uncharacterized protein n=1 Tax=Fusarium oxysporum (strain Fo5176) TaxID=660025 RepID=A0A0D2YKQ6_FUSOF